LHATHSGGATSTIPSTTPWSLITAAGGPRKNYAYVSAYGRCQLYGDRLVRSLALGERRLRRRVSQAAPETGLRSARSNIIKKTGRGREQGDRGQHNPQASRDASWKSPCCGCAAAAAITGQAIAVAGDGCWKQQQ
jgi:hypothetical protein